MTATDAIALYRRERAAYIERTAPERARITNVVREILARDEGGLRSLSVNEKGVKNARNRFAEARARGVAATAKKAQNDPYYYRKKKR